MVKRSINKFLAAGTFAAVVVSAVTPAALAHEGHVFKDINKNYEEAVYTLHDWGIVNGKADGTFGTYDNLTRGDAAVIMANALDLDIDNAPSAGFTDLNSRVAGAVNALAQEGIVSGVGKGKFAPNDPLTRGAMAKILVSGFGLEDFAVETTFNDASGVFGPYIEALYGAEITFGKTENSFGTYLNITRGDFANLLYRTFEFFGDYMSMPYAASAELVDANTLTVTLEEAAPAEYTDQDVAESLLIGIEYSYGSITMPTVMNAVLSADRMSVTFDISESLEGKEGTIGIDFIELPFDFAGPVAGKGSITLAEGTSPIAFDFAGKTSASVELPVGTSGTANLDELKMSVVDTFGTTPADVTMTLKSTTVEAAKVGEGQPWGTLKLVNGNWTLVDSEVYNTIEPGTYVLEAPFTDAKSNTTTLTLNLTVK